tara:strand:- start:3557 stop:3991 length:435 start_codon:yes stop_codon:yes gene_type:complete
MAIVINDDKKITENKNPIGIRLPLDKGNDVVGYFESTYTTFDATRENIRNLMLTNKGDRVFQPNLGMGLRRLLFENITDDLKVMITDDIKNNIATWLPYVTIKSIDLQSSEDDIHVDRNKIKINIEFFINNIPGTFDSVEVIIK